MVIHGCVCRSVCRDVPGCCRHAGVLHGLSKRHDLSQVPLLGSSSGAVVTALAASGACLEGAATRATDLFHELDIARRCVQAGQHYSYMPCPLVDAVNSRVAHDQAALVCFVCPQTIWASGRAWQARGSLPARHTSAGCR